VPTPAEARLNEGLRIVRRLSCTGCHVLEGAPNLEPAPRPGGDLRAVVVERLRDDHPDAPPARIRWACAPPVLTGVGERLQRDWIHDFLLDHPPVRPSMRVRVPSLPWREGEVAAVADALAILAALEDPATPVEEWPARDRIPERRSGRLEAAFDEEPDFLASVRRFAIDGPRCTRCHALRGELPDAAEPLDRAPDLDAVRDRLRPAWARRWLTDPRDALPGISVSAYFPPGVSPWPDLRPGSREEQIEDVLLWLFNLDRDR
jgi:hypothetical protein